LLLQVLQAKTVTMEKHYGMHKEKGILLLSKALAYFTKASQA
jgi:hypothetical protein